MLKAVHLTKRFGRTVAVDDLSFEVKRGEIVGFLGPNGAGKTTTMRILAGFFPPTGGTVTISGLDVCRDSLEVRRLVGYLPESFPVHLDMRVREYLRFRARLRGLHGRRLTRRVDEVSDTCGLADVERKVIGRLSKGYRQRVGLADSLVHEPDLLILDEPTIGLDPKQIRQMRHFIGNLAGRHTVLLSSHILSEIESVCQRVLIINRGRIVASDTPKELAALIKGDAQVVVEFQGARHALLDRLQAMPGVIKVSYQPLGEWHRFTMACPKDVDIRADVFKAAGAAGCVVRELRAERSRLEDVFIAMTADDAVPGAVAVSEETPLESSDIAVDEDERPTRIADRKQEPR